MTEAAQRRWLATMWPIVRSHLPPRPATIVELGCGRLGGFVPMLIADGYQALGVDPAAPDGESYRQLEFERAELPAPVDCVIACTSLHHVADADVVLDKLAAALRPAGVVVVLEWDWEGFDEATARWCFERLEPGETDGWLQRHRDGWAASGKAWDAYLRGWTDGHGILSVRQLVEDLDRRFERVVCQRGPYCFQDLRGTSETEELDAIGAGRIHATRIDYVGRVA
jgi:SAM-dependent methyltransferase